MCVAVLESVITQYFVGDEYSCRCDIDVGYILVVLFIF